jgi:hypothetical protein
MYVQAAVEEVGVTGILILDASPREALDGTQKGSRLRLW